MPTEVLIDAGTQIRFSVNGSLSPVDAATNLTIGTPTDVDMTMSGVADDAARQSDKADLGANWARRYAVLASQDFTGETPVINTSCDYYWAPSTSATTANGNIAGNSGLDAAAPDGALGSISLDEFLALCQRIGQLPIHDGAVVQTGFVGIFMPATQWGQMIVANRSGDAFEADNVEHHIVMIPLIDEIQDT